MKERTYYEAVEGTEVGNLLLGNPNSKAEKLRWNRFKTYEDAKNAVEKAIKGRKHQYFYFRNEEGKVVDKVSYYERYPLTYKIYKIVEQEEELFSCDNSDIELKQVDDKLQEEMPL